MKKLVPWLPAIVLMAVIFGFSSIPGRVMPVFGSWDFYIKKGGHMVGYALLTLSFWYAQDFDRRCWWLALLLALLYAISDEFHQSFVPGRHSAWADVLFIDSSGGLLGLLVGWLWLKIIKK